MKILAVLSVLFMLSSTKVKQVQWDDIDGVLKSDNDTTYVINFWATWCGPCVKEMPDFERLSQETKGEKVKFIFISLDSEKRLSTAVQPLVDRMNIASDVWLYHNPDFDSWIPKVYAHWQGAIPATLIINNHKKYRSFKEGGHTYETLKSLVNKIK